MNVHEMHNNFAASVGLAPVAAALADDTAQVCAIVDMQDMLAVEHYIITGTLADVNATFAVTVAHGDAVDDVGNPTTITDSAAVTADDGVLIGTLAGASFDKDADSAVKRIGYSAEKGAGKRYHRLTITPSGNTGNAPLAVLVVGIPKQRPVA